ncbi:MAG: hypothetical protein ACRD1T_03680, partial [Acidimicrobiia bacterium]
MPRNARPSVSVYTVEAGKWRSIPKLHLLALAVVLSLWLPFGAPATAQEQGSDRSLGPHVSQSIVNDTSPPLRSLMAASRVKATEGETEEEEGTRRLPPRRPPKNQDQPKTPLQSVPTEARAPMPAPSVSFDGIANADNPFLVRPPDPVMDVGPNHIVQAVNLSFAIYDKTGTELVAPAPLDSVWSGMPGNNVCEDQGFGDPIVLYDHLADRWLISQLAIPSGFTEFHQCIAVSTTGDPTGSYHTYDFLYSKTLLNDYPKLGVWPDGYYMTVNQFEKVGNEFFYAGVGVVAFERDAMLNGQSA